MQTCPAIAFQGVSFSYEEGAPVLTDLSFTVEHGEMVALMGGNGSGKSTVAKLVDAMLMPSAGTVRVCGMDTQAKENLFCIRRACGLVFQNPDDQLVSTLVHDEVAFGPRNLGLPEEEVTERVEEALRAVGMQDARDADVNALSGGQQQRIAIAGALAMRPQILILDEATSMLDEASTREIILMLRRLHDAGMTLLLITHDETLACSADRILCLSEEDVPEARPLPQVHSKDVSGGEVPAVALEKVAFSYADGGPSVLTDFSLTVERGSFVAITGPNGCGKSTLLKLMNGLLQPQTGTVRINGVPLMDKTARNRARFQVGLAFQHPERQLFESTVYDDVAFGPRALGLEPTVVEERVRAALSDVGLPFTEIYRRNPFLLSGGQQRKVALAGILSLRTPIVALDEPCAGLDGQSKHELLELLCRLNEGGATIIMVTHDVRDAEALGCRLISL